MDAMDAILTRRSIRKYTGRPVSEETVKELLTAAMSAPTAADQRTWEFVVIDNRKILNEIPGFHPHSKMLLGAPLAVCVCSDLRKETRAGYWPQECGAATQNILIAANALGLGAVWLGIHPVEERVEGLKKLLGLPEGVMPLSLIALGYPAEEKPPLNRYEGGKVHRNGW
ncbi:MAG: nitroreductase family protein [Deltaproteobacteria bacterium]|uniref:Nitroreductase family protein n=1 Tax=Candidatus Zymogenus saltonus TaxID=2844893 RepID=A0A9D8PMA4_9DELT|nr:nitroreductase family protein [Candidatus Zymogenus saltonus]